MDPKDSWCSWSAVSTTQVEGSFNSEREARSGPEARAVQREGCVRLSEMERLGPFRLVSDHTSVSSLVPLS